MIVKLRSLVAAARSSEFGRNAIWFTGLSAFERIIAVTQTILISRALGITEYGVYGLLFGTIGFIASVAGLQMGLTATVFVAKYRDAEKAKAAAIIAIATRFGLIIAIVVLLVALPFGERLSELLLGSVRYQVPILLGIVFVGSTVMSGVQDGVAQGFEIFGTLAKLKIVTSALTLTLIFPAAKYLGLIGVLCAILSGLFLKYLILEILVRKSRSKHQIPRKGTGVSFIRLVSGFAFPSMAVSLTVGFITWMGMLLLSRQVAGFDGVAIVNTGLQWRGPVLMLAASLGSVAVPAFSRLEGGDDLAGSRKLRQTLILINLIISAALSVAVIVGSGYIMKLYGSEFAQGRLAFCLVVMSTVPTVVANVYMQQLVGAARMWRQVWLQGPYVIVLAASFLILVPRYQAAGYSVSLLIASLIFLSNVLLMDYLERRRNASAKSTVNS
jgi:O-antigen/teichoic acid export membrane protein